MRRYYDDDEVLESKLNEKPVTYIIAYKTWDKENFRNVPVEGLIMSSIATTYKTLNMVISNLRKQKLLSFIWESLDKIEIYEVPQELGLGLTVKFYNLMRKSEQMEILKKCVLKHEEDVRGNTNESYSFVRSNDKMRRYYDNYNDDYEEGYEAGRRDALLGLDEKVDTRHRGRELTKMLKQVDNIWAIRYAMENVERELMDISKKLGYADITYVKKSEFELLKRINEKEREAGEKTHFWTDLSLDVLKGYLNKLKRYGIDINKKYSSAV